MSLNKLNGLLGIASKAGKLSYGFNDSIFALKSKKALLFLCDSSISQKTEKELRFYGEKQNIQLYKIANTDFNLSDIVGRSCKVISVNDKSFAKGIKDALKMEE